MTGQNFTLPIIGNGSIYRVYEFFDKPIVFSTISDTGYNLFFLISSKNKSDVWICAPCTKEKLAMVENGRLSSYDLLRNAPSNTIIQFIVEGINTDFRILNSSEITDDILPDPEYIINIHDQEFADVLVPTLANVTGLTHVNLKISPNDGPKSTIPMKQLGIFLQNFQESIDNIAMNLLGNLNLRGRVPVAITNQTTLDYASGFNSSVGISLISRNEAMLENGTLANSLEILGHLIESRGNISDVSYMLSETNHQITDRSLLKFKGMLISLASVEAGLELAWSDRNGRGGYHYANANDIHVSLHEIGKHINSTDRVITVVGRFSSGDIDTHRFKIIDSDSGNQYAGYSEESMDRLGISIQLGKTYKALMRETVSLNEITGQETYSYSLISLKEIESPPI